MSADTQGLWLEATMVGHQTAWLRRADGGWVGHVVIQAGSANRLSRLAMPNWFAHRMDFHWQFPGPTP